jgi:peptidoglycan/LPS O-acetylase OafA/YrhL
VVTALIGNVAGAQHSPVLLLRSFQLIGGFAVGIAALEITRRDGYIHWRGSVARPPWAAISIGLLCLWAVASLNHVPFILSMGALIIALGTGSLTWLAAVLRWRPLVWLGLISYSLWLVHAPLVHLVWLKLLHPLGLDVGEPATLFALLGVAVPLSIVTAWGFYHLVEQRSLTPVSLLRRRRELDAAPETPRVHAD